MTTHRVTLLFWLSIVMFCASLGALIFFVRLIIETNTRTALVTQNLEIKIKEFENQNELKKKRTEAQSVSTRIEDYLVDADRVDDFIARVESVGDVSGSEVHIQSAEINPNNPKQLSLKLSLGGTFTSALYALSLFEVLPYDISISDVYINKDTSPNKNGTESSLWQIDVLCLIQTK